MDKKIERWRSSNLNKNMELAIYGREGAAVLMFIPSETDITIFEKSQIIESVSDLLENRNLILYCLCSFDNETWLNEELSIENKLYRYKQSAKFISHEALSFIQRRTLRRSPIYTLGVSSGALTAINVYMHNSDIIRGAIGFSGLYDIRLLAGDKITDDFLFFSPVDYFSSLKEGESLRRFRDNRGIIIASGQGTYENPRVSRIFSQILKSQSIPHVLDIWDSENSSGWALWTKMFSYYINKNFLSGQLYQKDSS